MKNEPAIVKELRQAEKLGLLRSESQGNLRFSEEENNDDKNSKYLAGDYVDLKEEIDLGDLKEIYKNIFDKSAVAIMLTDNKERIISWNKYTEKLLGYAEADLYFKPVQSLYPSEEWKKIRSENIRQKGMKHSLETKIWTKKDKLLDVDISLSILKNNEGKIIGSIGIIKDISNKKKIERELAYNNDLLQSLMDYIPDCIYFKDEQGRFIKVNKAKAQRVNKKPEELTGTTEADFLPIDYAQKTQEDEKNVMETGKPIINKVEKIVDNQGLEHWISITKIPRYNKDNNIIGIIGINRDITEIKKSEEKYKHLFDKAIDPIIIIDKKGKFVDVNEEVIKLLEYNKKDLIGKDFTKINILTQRSIKKTQDNLLKKMKGENVPPYEVEVITKTGEIIPTEINASTISECNQVKGYLIILRDLRERYKRKKIEKELNTSELKFRDIFEGTSDLLIYIEKGIILDINNAIVNLLNIKKQDVVGKKISIFKNYFTEEDSEKHINAIDLASTGNEVTDYETELITNKGLRYEFLFSVDCICNDEYIKGIILQGKDITQRNHELKELVKLEEKYRILAETSADGVITIDPLGRLTYVNPSFEKMLNRRKSQILATLLRDYLSEDSVYLFQQIFIDARKKDEKIENIELELVHTSGQKVPIDVNVASFKRDGKFAGMVLTIRDITERRKIEDELKKSDKLRTEFMNIAAHELKSPVTPIKGYLDLIICDKDSNEKIKNWAKISLRNSERLLKLVNDILDVSRLETDTMRFDMEKISAVDILDEVAEDMKPVVEGKGLKFITDIPRDLPDITGDKFRLAQVFKNLLVNAIKFTDNGSISINAKQKKDYILISVTDSGIGIYKDELKKIFNKFYQAYTGEDRKHEGTGLGLFICNNIIQKHNGKIWAESHVGKGSTFYIEIPYLHKMAVNLKK